MTGRPAFGPDGALVAPPGHTRADLLRTDASTLRRRLAAREVSSRDLVSVCLEQIERVNPTYNAVVSARPADAVLAEADGADAALARGEPVGPLHGLPIAIKDLAATRGLRTTYGSPLYADHVPDADELAVARIRKAGAIIVGKTNVPEFGLGSHTYNSVFGPTRNAYDPTLSAGGSSGGAAVVLALGLLPLAEGSDLGGSLRNPAAWNNVFGFRPSQGRVPSVPTADPFYSQLSTPGPMGRSVADLAMLLSVMAGHDRHAPLSLDDEPGRRFEDGLDGAPAQPRIGWLGDLDGHLPFESGILDLCHGALARLAPNGWAVEDVNLGFDWLALWRAFVVLRQFSIIGRYAPLHADRAKRALLKPAMMWEIESGLALDATTLAEAAATRGAWYEKLLPLFERFDAVALPSAQVFPFPVGWDWPRAIAGRAMDSYHRWMEVVVPGTLSGCPVVSVPVGFDERGRAMGVQLIGRPRGDAALLALAARYERDASGRSAQRSD